MLLEHKGAGRIFAAGDRLGAGGHAGSQVGRGGVGDGFGTAAALARIGGTIPIAACSMPATTMSL
jgi:hypothetical protein